MKKEQKIIGLKDLVLTLLLALLTLVIALVIMTPLAALGILAQTIIAACIPAFVGGFVYVLIQTKAPRIGTSFLYSLIFAANMFIVSSPIAGVLFLITGAIGELTMLGGHGKKWRPLIPYLIHWLTYTYAATIQFAFMRGSVLSTFMSSGMDEASANIAVDTIGAVYTAPQNVLLMGVCTAATAVLGYYLGTKILRKHFAASGIV